MYYVTTIGNTSGDSIWTFSKLEDALAKMSEFATVSDAVPSIQSMLEQYSRYYILTEKLCVQLFMTGTR